MIYWFIDFNSLILLISGVTGDLWWSIDLHFNGHCWMIYLFLLLVSMAGWLVHITVLLHIVVCPLLLHIPWLVGSTLMGFMPILFYALLLVGSNCYASFYIFHALCLIAGWFYIASIALLPCDALDGLCPYWWFMCWCMPLWCCCGCFMVPQPYGCICVGDERNPLLITFMCFILNRWEN